MVEATELFLKSIFVSMESSIVHESLIVGKNIAFFLLRLWKTWRREALTWQRNSKASRLVVCFWQLSANKWPFSVVFKNCKRGVLYLIYLKKKAIWTRCSASSFNKYFSVFPSLFSSPLLIIHTTLIVAFTSLAHSLYLHHLYLCYSLSSSNF